MVLSCGGCYNKSVGYFRKLEESDKNEIATPLGKDRFPMAQLSLKGGPCCVEAVQFYFLDLVDRCVRSAPADCHWSSVRGFYSSHPFRHAFYQLGADPFPLAKEKAAAGKNGHL